MNPCKSFPNILQILTNSFPKSCKSYKSLINPSHILQILSPKSANPFPKVLQILSPKSCKSFPKVLQILCDSFPKVLWIPANPCISLQIHESFANPLPKSWILHESSQIPMNLFQSLVSPHESLQILYKFVILYKSCWTLPKTPEILKNPYDSFPKSLNPLRSFLKVLWILWIFVNHFPKSCKSCKSSWIISPSLVNPFQSLTNGHKSFVNPHESFPKVLQIPTNPLKSFTNPFPNSCKSPLQILVNPFPKYNKSSQILSQSLANPHDSFTKVSQMPVNPHESFFKVSLMPMNHHKSFAKAPQIPTNHLPKSCKSPQILCQSLAKPHKSSWILSQSPQESFTNSFPKPHISPQILVNPFLIINNTPYLVDYVLPTYLDINTALIFLRCIWTLELFVDGTFYHYWGLARIRNRFARICATNLE